LRAQISSADQLAGRLTGSDLSDINYVLHLYLLYIYEFAGLNMQQDRILKLEQDS